MSIASLGIASSLASTALPQRAADADKTHRETTERSRALDSIESAAAAAGIGETTEDAQTSDRDADGRRLWEEPAAAGKNDEPAADAASAEPVSRDASGACGNLLDLHG